VPIYLSGTQVARLYTVLQGSGNALPDELHPLLNNLERELFSYLSVEEGEAFQQAPIRVPEKISALRYVLKQEENE
jgi:hypothetical protein